MNGETKMKRCTIAGGVLALVLGSCGSSTTATSSPNTGLSAAAAVTAKGALQPGQLVQVDKAGVMSYKVSDDTDEGPTLDVEVRAEAPGAVGTLPEFSILCANSTKTGGYMAQSTVSFGAAVPAGSFLAGTVLLILPDDGRYGLPIPTCATPAVVKLGVSGITIGKQAADVVYAIPDAVIAEINADAAKYNAALPPATT